MDTSDVPEVASRRNTSLGSLVEGGGGLRGSGGCVPVRSDSGVLGYWRLWCLGVVSGVSHGG